MNFTPRIRQTNTLAIFGTVLLLAFGTVTSPSAFAEIPGLDALGDLVREKFDTDSNNQISSAEWQAGITAGFDELDRDGDGSLTAAELDQLADSIRDKFGDLGAVLVSALIKSAVLAFDTNGNQLVSRSEYNNGARKVFSALDRNDDGSVTQAELEKLPSILLNFAK